MTTKRAPCVRLFAAGKQVMSVLGERELPDDIRKKKLTRREMYLADHR